MASEPHAGPGPASDAGPGSPPPPPARRTFRVLRLPAGTALARVAIDNRGATEFADCAGGPRRFSPLVVDGVCVPALYLATDEAGAIMETVFHDVRLQDAHPRVYRDDIVRHRLSTVTPLRPLRLARLDDEALPDLGLSCETMIDSGATAFTRTVRWAEAAYRARVRGGGLFDGIVWNARRHPSRSALMLFGDRVDRRRDLDVTTAPLPLASQEGLLLVLRLATAHGITVVH